MTQRLSNIRINLIHLAFNKTQKYINLLMQFIFIIFKLLRVHQWTKNLLIFVPLILAQEFSELNLTIFLAFFSFSFVASSLYIFNDIKDLESDRLHPAKQYRPIASGLIRKSHSLILLIFLLFSGLLTAAYLNDDFFLILVIYSLLSFFYTVKIKKIALLDILLLSLLYLLRIVSGAALLEISLSNWLITFSIFFFIFLASIKRFTEIRNISLKKEGILLRDYSQIDLDFMNILSFVSGLISVLVICLYLDSENLKLLYSNSDYLWISPMIILYWILNLLLQSNRNNIDYDPLIFAMKSYSSYFVIFSLSLIFYISI